jgi:flagellar biosynthetic protein FlhB
VFAAIVIIAVVLSNVAVGGWVNSSKPLVPDFSRINPLSGFGRLFTKDKLADVGKMLLIVIVLSIIGTSST